jgi:NADH:ubiquinone oxidoreductase subunit 6 (subunit J)
VEEEVNTILAFVRSDRFFPCLIMSLYILSSARYFLHKNVGHGMYWISAFMITFTVTFLMKGPKP